MADVVVVLDVVELVLDIVGVMVDVDVVVVQSTEDRVQSFFIIVTKVQNKSNNTNQSK